jgi:hypothetical protein
MSLEGVKWTCLRLVESIVAQSLDALGSHSPAPQRHSQRPAQPINQQDGRNRDNGQYRSLTEMAEEMCMVLVMVIPPPPDPLLLSP